MNIFYLIFGKLNLDAIDFHNWIIMGAFGGMVLAFIIILILITYFKKWKYLWKEWMTSVDHKKIGAMYVLIAIVMGIRGFVDSAMMRSHLAFSYGTSHGYLEPEHYNQVFSGHGVIMIFLMAMPFMIGLMNVAMPLQIGARDVAFPVLNSISLWLLIAAVVLMNISLGIGEFAKTGWVAYPPLSEIEYSPYVGVDYYIWILQIAGISSLLTGINFITTILRMRAPGMTLMKMPLFSWTALATSILIIGAFPILTVDLALLSLDRYLDFHFFTNTSGGNMTLYVNWFWAWGHPEVYILILPAFGVFSEIVANLANKRLFGYPSMVFSIVAILIISYIVWVHHFFAMGAGGTVNAVFGIMTMIIAIPTGVKIYNWLFTMYQGKIQLDTPMLWTIGFLLTFVIGGMTGVMLAIPPADFVLHNSQFLISHFHNVIISGVVFGGIAGYIYWFPKVFGFQLNEKIGKIAFYLFIIGLVVFLASLYLLGFMGMTRRINHYDVPAWQPPMWAAAVGVFLIALGLAFLVLQLIASIRQRNSRPDLSGDPWKGRTLEWSVASPAPEYNFAFIPTVEHLDEFWERKEKGTAYQKKEKYEDIIMPKNSALGFFLSICAGVFGFGMVWYIWWMPIAALIAVFITLVLYSLKTPKDLFMTIPKEEVEKQETNFLARIKNLKEKNTSEVMQ